MATYQEQLRKMEKTLREKALNCIKSKFEYGADFIKMEDCPIGSWETKEGRKYESLRPWQTIQKMGDDYYQVQHENGDYYPLQKLPLHNLCQLADYLNEDGHKLSFFTTS